MADDKRKGENPIPDDIKSYLNEDQLDQLHKIEGFGWHLKYVRRPVFQEPVIIVTSQDGKSIGILEEDGRLNLEPDIKIRSE